MCLENRFLSLIKILLVETTQTWLDSNSNDWNNWFCLSEDEVWDKWEHQCRSQSFYSPVKSRNLSDNSRNLSDNHSRNLDSNSLSTNSSNLSTEFHNHDTKLHYQYTKVHYSNTKVHYSNTKVHYQYKKVHYSNTKLHHSITKSPNLSFTDWEPVYPWYQLFSNPWSTQQIWEVTSLFMGGDTHQWICTLKPTFFSLKKHGFWDNSL